ncbi:nonstructural polyprotein [Cylindrotheca closterium RNA virus 02]|nr:nonstructural polyprotein [Cylindrotheca closterium RNA virus 02]
MKIKVSIRSKRVLSGKIGKMVRYSSKILDQVFMTEASVKEQRRAFYYKNRVDQFNHQDDNSSLMYSRRMPNWQHSAKYHLVRSNEKRVKHWEPTLFPIYEAETVNELNAQIGFESLGVSDAIYDLIINKLGIKCSDDIISEIEGMILLFISVSNSSNIKGALAAIGLYIRKKFNKSLSSEIMIYLVDLFEYSTQSGFEDEKEEDPEWLSFMKNVKSNWLECRNSSLFKNFSKVLSIIVMSGLYRISDMTFSIRGHKVFEPDMKMLTSSAGDIMTAVANIVVYFSERIYLAWKNKSLQPFMVDSLETAELEQEFVQLMNNWDLYRNGNLTKIKGMEPSQFLSNLLDMTHKLESMLPSAKGLDKKILETKYRECVKVVGDFQMIRGNSSFRRSPFCIEYYGLSAVGKSTISEQTSDYLLRGAGLDHSDFKKYTYVSGKKHWDGARSDMVELKIDDHANVKSDFVETSPCDVIIKVCNNVPYSPPMADLINKGKVYIEPELVTLTTNVENLDAATYSNNPFSIQRRMHLIVEVEVKEEFVRYSGGVPAGIDTSLVHAHYTKNGVLSLPPYHDVWEVTVKKAVAAPNVHGTGDYVIVEHEGKALHKISMNEWLNYAAIQFKQHRDQQKIMAANSAVELKTEPCGIDGCTQIKGYCMKHCDCQIGLESFRNYCRQTTDSLLQEGREFYDSHDWLPYLPDSVMSNKYVRYLFTLSNAKNLAIQYKKYSKINGVFWMSIIGLFACNTSNVVGILGTIASFFGFGLFQYLLINKVRNDYLRRLDQRHNLNEIHREWRNRLGKTILASSAVLGSIYMIAKTYKTLFGVDCQGNLEPKTAMDIMKRDNEPNVWATIVKRPLPCTQKSIEHTVDVVEGKVKKNLLYATIVGDDGLKRMGNVLFLDSNMVIVPDHYFLLAKSDSLELTCYKENATAVGGHFITRVDKVSSHLIEGTDLRVCYSSAGGSYGNLVDYFPTGDIVDHGFRMLWRAKDGYLTSARGAAKAKRTGHTFHKFPGGEYTHLSINTFSGLCGAVLISENKQTCITGIHLGGKDGTTRGCFGTLTRDQIIDVIDRVKKVPGVIKTGTMGDFKPQVLGKTLLTSDPLHPKSPVNYLPEGSQFEYYGSCIGATTSRSDVRETPISQFVEEETGVANIWGKPKMKPEYEGWQKAMANASHPARPVKHEILKKSVEDYRRPLLELARQDPWCNEKPLTYHENLCGRVGCKFIDAIPLNTAIGYPLVGPKRDFVTQLEPTPERPNIRILDPEIMEYIDECEDNYKKGIRNHFVAKACKKDEVLPVAKGKCRIFYANPIALTWLVRKYFLPVIRMLQMNPLLAECAVGINCHGPEWDQFYNFVMTHGDDHLIGGDYGKYDQKLPAQKLIAALSILIDIATEMDYSDENIKVMESMVGDIVYAIIAYNGDLLGIQSGTHISGNSLTVILNGISGSLNLRDFFYTKYSGDVSFRDAIALMTYGDDNIGSVSPDFPEFNIKGAAEFLGDHGQIYTMPDKESELKAHLDPKDFEFLKRFSVYHPKLGYNIGALLDKSIIKSLHCYMRPKGCPLTPEEACAQNIDTALREWFNHGEDVYEMRRTQMINVAKKGNIAHLCTMLDQTYDNRVVDWKFKYAGGPRPHVHIEDFTV